MLVFCIAPLLSVVVQFEFTVSAFLLGVFWFILSSYAVSKSDFVVLVMLSLLAGHGLYFEIFFGYLQHGNY